MNLESWIKSKRLLLFILLAYFILHTSYFIAPIFAQSISDQEKKLQDLQQQISSLENQLNDNRGQQKTLKSQLQFIDTQTEITHLKVEQTNTQIAKLGREIEDLSGRIDRLSTTVDSISEVLLTRIVQTYKYGNADAINLLFSANGFSDLLLRTKYLQVAQANDKKVLYQLQATKQAFNDQKQDKQTRQIQQESLKKDLVKYETQLVAQKKSLRKNLKRTY
jgi:peptidoglycan hydrolase CwlO-like protein